MLIISTFGEEFEIGEITSKKGIINFTNIAKTDSGYKINFDFVVPKEKKRGYLYDKLEVSIKGQEDKIVSASSPKIYSHHRLYL